MVTWSRVMNDWLRRPLYGWGEDGSVGKVPAMPVQVPEFRSPTPWQKARCNNSSTKEQKQADPGVQWPAVQDQ